MSRTNTLQFGKTENLGYGLNLGTITPFVTAFPTQHIKGSSAFLLKDAINRIFYTGDFYDIELPERPVDLLIMEGKRVGKSSLQYIGKQHAFEDKLLDVIGRLNPVYVIMIHGRYNALLDFQNRFHDLPILVPAVNEEVILGE